NQYSGNPLAAGRYAALRRDDFSVVVPAVPGAADHRQADPAVVRRLGRRVDHVPGLLPERAARRLRLRRLDHAARLAPAGLPARRAARLVARLSADHRLDRLEAPGQ